MEISFSDLKNKEVVNVYDGKKLGHISDIVFDGSNGQVQGVVVPGDKKLFRKSEDVFIPLAKIKKIGNDVILVILQNSKNAVYANQNAYRDYGYNEKRAMKNNVRFENLGYDSRKSFVRYKRIDKKKYK